MRNKECDIPYCGVNKTRIRKAEPELNEKNVAHLLEFITERYKIHLKKDVNKEAGPYTDNEVLQQYRFCNIRREHDRESKWLIKNISTNPDLSYPNKILNTILFRLFNKHETIEIFGLLNFNSKKFDPEDYRELLVDKAIEHPDFVFFTSAFYTSGTKMGMVKYIKDEPFVPMRVLRYVQYLAKYDIVSQLEYCDSQKEVFKVLTSFNGLGDFLAYQIYVDLTYIPEFPFSENEFVVSGPGCKKGLDYIFEDRDGLTYDEALFWLRDNLDHYFQAIAYGDYDKGYIWNPKKLFSDLPEWDRRVNIMSLENCMCEISKYIRAVEGTGRPRNIYKPSKKPMPF